MNINIKGEHETSSYKFARNFLIVISDQFPFSGHIKFFIITQTEQTDTMGIGENE